MSKPIISVSGLRGIVGKSLNPILAAQYALAFAQHLKPGSIVIGRDGRETGAMFADAIAASLMSAGFEVLDAGVCATPTLGVLVRKTGSSGGLQISASHNPPEYNGIKLFGASGRVITANQGQEVIESFERNEFGYVQLNRVGQKSCIQDTTESHLRLVLGTVDVERIRSRRLKVVLDSNHGAGSLLARKLLSELHCDFKILGDCPDGQFEHVPEPTEDNLKEVATAAKDFDADVVFCQDPDADRLAIINNHGKYIGEEYTLAITMQHALASQNSLPNNGMQDGVVVINCATSRMSVDIAESFGAECRISAVGEANVTQEMIDQQAIYGGEGNGGPIDPRVGYVRDSFVAMAQTMDAMSMHQASIDDLVSAIPEYSIVKSKLPLEKEKLNVALQAVENVFNEATVNRLDGLRLDFEKAWLLIRASNTEPIVRVIAEAGSRELATDLVAKAQEVIQAS